jgi:DNA helicase IV
VDPAELLTGLDEVTTYGDRIRRDQEAREAARRERSDYAHVIVDEAQDLTPMQWRMVGRRARNATWTIVGDPAQSSWIDPAEAAAAMDETLGGKPRRRFTLTTNYRNPAEIAEVAARVLAQAAPGTEAPKAVRATGVVPRFTAVAAEERMGAAARAEVERLLAEVDGTVGIVVPMDRRDEAARWIAGLGDRAVALGSLEAKGLEYDGVVVVGPSEIADEADTGGRRLYVALTRATQRLTVVTTDPRDARLLDLHPAAEAQQP